MGTYLIAFKFGTIRSRMGYRLSRDLDDLLARSSQDREREHTDAGHTSSPRRSCDPSCSFSCRGVDWMASTMYINSFCLCVRWWFVTERRYTIYSKSPS